MRDTITVDCSGCNSSYTVKMKDLKAYSKSLYPRTRKPMPKMSEEDVLIVSTFVPGCPSCLPDAGEWKDIPAVEWVKK